ncbi:hypothetical protein BWI97_26965 [Siphonobacter sp. BAB-5405]|uniref:hypothetical protein n=1 Tax=Siphonobacter sp. BAB-5405 TaxID=1864825 RepID=UPI000C8059A2|nr:hypothetical protein [Siphonobacter sp. BAB-5405]PMD83952.1 hypothetical protein BWI97_26965 [Siphonobacter sp. BAB-5405]
MTTLRNGLQTLSLTASTNAQATSVLEMMSRQTEHLVRMVDDLLAVSQGKIELRKASVNQVELTRQATESIPALVQQNQREGRFKNP